MPQFSADEYYVSGTNQFGADRPGGDDHSDSRCVDKDSIALALVYNFGVSGDDRDVGGLRRLLH